MSESVTATERRLEGFIDRFTPEVAADARVALAKLRTVVPGARELVYDNYNGLVIGFCPNERPSDAILSIAIFPTHVTLCFLQGAAMPDPDGILNGSGNVVRHLRLETQTTIEEPAVQRAIALALDLARVPIDPRQPRHLEIRSVSEKQRPRRPEPKAAAKSAPKAARKPTPKAAPGKRNGDRR